MQHCCGNVKPIDVYVELAGKQDYHESLKGRDEADQHPIGAITNLQDNLDEIQDNLCEIEDNLREKTHSVLRYKGQVTDYASLPIVDNTVGDVYNTVDTGANYLWTGNSWDNLSPVITLDDYVTRDYLEGRLDASINLLQEHLRVHYYEKSEIDTLLSSINNNVDFLDSKIDDINTSLSTSITELDNKIDEIGSHIINTYTTNEIDTLLSTKADLSDAQDMQDQVDAIEDTITQIQDDITKIKVWNVINE